MSGFGKARLNFRPASVTDARFFCSIMNKMDVSGAKANMDTAADALQLEKLGNRCEYKAFPLTCKVAKNGGQPDPNVFKALDWLIGAIAPEYDRACSCFPPYTSASFGHFVCRRSATVVCTQAVSTHGRECTEHSQRQDGIVSAIGGPHSRALNKRITNAKAAAEKKREEERRKRAVRPAHPHAILAVHSCPLQFKGRKLMLMIRPSVLLVVLTATK
jgi:hypothetical protein